MQVENIGENREEARELIDQLEAGDRVALELRRIEYDEKGHEIGDEVETGDRATITDFNGAEEPILEFDEVTFHDTGTGEETEYAAVSAHGWPNLQMYYPEREYSQSVVSTHVIETLVVDE